MTQIKHAIRSLLRTPVLTAIAVLSLALGIGANAAIFSLFDQILLEPLPVPEPDRLVNFSAPGPKHGSTSCNQAGDCDVVLSHPLFRDLEREHPGFSGIAGHRAIDANLATGERTFNGEGMLVSGSYFSVLELRPALGRLLTPEDDRVVGEHPVTVLSHRFWQNEFGGDPEVLNTTLILNGRAMTIVGVAPAGFRSTTYGSRPDVFVPMRMRAALNPGWEGFDDRRAYWVYGFGRLARGVSLERASVEVNRVYTAILNETEAELQEGMSDRTLAQFLQKALVLTPGFRGQSSVHDQVLTPLLLLLAITGVVLLIACANIANLLLARGAQRSTEMAIRGSIGAGRWQLLRQLLTESLLLAAAGGLLSLAMAKLTLVGIGSLMPPEVAADMELQLRPVVVLFTAIAAVGTAIIFGLYPSLNATRVDLATVLKSGASSRSGARSAARFRTGLVTAQIALSMALLVAAGLFIRSLGNLSRVDLGLRTENMVTFAISPELNGYEAERIRPLFQRLEEELAAVPGVTDVTLAMIPVLGGNSWGSNVEVEGFESGPDIDSNARFNKVGPGYFSMMGMPLIAGREFTPADAGEKHSVAVVNEAFARKFGLDPRAAVGTLMGTSSELDIQIVGVVQDAKYNQVKGDVPAVFFLPQREDPDLGFAYFYARTGGPTTPVLRAIPDVVKRLDPNLPVEQLKTLEQQAAEDVFMDRLITILSAAFAALATVLAAIGLYGVLAYSTARRTREIGLRMAMGAGSPDIRWMVLRQVVAMLVVGGLVGMAAALAVGRAASSLLYEVEGHDPAAIIGGALLLTAVALAAGLIPAWKASHVDPMEALRYE